MADGYTEDFHAWALGQADALRRRSANEVDWENLAEELRSLGSQEEWQLYNRLIVLCAHLLKWRYQPAGRCVSWERTIKVQRRDIAKHLRKNPSLKSVQATEFDEAYGTARIEAAAETLMPETAFPTDPAFTLAEALDPEFWPGGEPEPR